MPQQVSVSGQSSSRYETYIPYSEYDDPPVVSALPELSPKHLKHVFLDSTVFLTWIDPELVSSVKER